jgi:antitoxin (DNA-binding transcriptional repressor) of toxin-antitoxin stability system
MRRFSGSGSSGRTTSPSSATRTALELVAGRSTGATVRAVRREITQRELRNESGDVMRALDRGDAFVVTRNGVAVGELTPFLRRRFVNRDAALAAFARAAPIDAARWRKDLDRVIGQDPSPRG